MRVRHPLPSVRQGLLLAATLCVALGVAGCKEQGDIRIRSLDFEGVRQVNKAALASALQTRRGSRLPWGRKAYFDRRAFDADLQRIRAYYADRGFPDARVSDVDVRLNDPQDEVSITVRISEGEPVVVDALDLQGVDVLAEGPRRGLRESLPLRVGAPLDRQLAQASRERVLNVLRDAGYPYAEVSLSQTTSAPRRERIVLAATPGVQAHFGEVEIVGPRSVAPQVVRRQLTYRPGDLFTRREMRESQRRIYGLELFEFANVESLEDRQAQAAEVPTRVTVAEGKHRKFTFGLGYGSEERARARIRWDHANLMGAAEHLGIEAKWSSLERGVRAEFREPYFLAPHFSLQFEGQAWQAAEPVYSLNQLGGRVTLRHQANSQNSWGVSFASEFQRSSVVAEALTDFSIRNQLIALGLDPRTGESRGTLSSLSFDLSRNTTGSLLDARNGYVVNAHVEQAGTWLRGSWNFWTATVEGRHYLSIGRRLVIANRLRLGTIDPLGGDLEANVPFYRRFFIGGASSLRGWGRFEVSPLSGFGLPIGGHSMVEGSSEVRLPLMGKIGAVAFVDYGNVWMGANAFDLGDLRVDVGPGLRYLTPVGPARIDFGYQLTPEANLRVRGEPERRQWRVHFSIGQAF